MLGFLGPLVYPAKVRTGITLKNCYVASENTEFGTTLARRLNSSRASAVLQSNLTAISKFGTAKVRCLNWS